ncbi:outer membrane beta-barrel protein [Roseateles sp. SL47]|jgi:outer membrane protein|uniref:OmpW/AlkL family protein n=1 Tax=Roseateles sp. SL47 TaxID=2995138 RepID=UPI00226F00D2|nr:OmpW family outer membrane protein [Roseateles sp. SL47]WAC73562.1 outer membrane beta-barrel protein [Roseateles sp. SL47]
MNVLRSRTARVSSGLVATAAAVMGLCAPVMVQAQSVENPWLVRVRALHLDSANKDSTGLDLSINNKTFPEFDVSYFFTPNFAAELVLTYPQKQKLYSGGTQIGSLKHLPPTLTAQYHFNPAGQVRPYVGAGVNYTNFSSVHFNSDVQAALEPSIKKNSFGLAAQVGVDVMLDKQWSLNFDIKKVQIRTKVSSAGTEVGKFKVDPLLIGVGVGYRF